MKQRILALLLGTAMAFSLLTGCGSSGGDLSLSDTMAEAIPAAAQKDVVKYLTNNQLKSDTVIMTVAGQDIPATYYLYWMAYYTNQMYSYYAYYGQELDLTAADGDGTTIAQQIQTFADSAVKSYTVGEQTAINEYGLSLSEEEQAAVDDYEATQTDDAMIYFCTTAADQVRIYTQYQLSSKLRNTLYGTDGERVPTQETLQDYANDNGYYNCRYILCQPADSTEEAIAEAKEKCQSIYDELSKLEGDELLARFQELQAENPDGNTDEFAFNDSSSLTEGFRETLAEMEINELGMTDQTDYGYFTLLRLDVDLTSLQEDYISDDFVTVMNGWVDDAEFTTTSAYDKIDANTFCQNVLQLQRTIDQAAVEGDSSAE